MFGRKKIKDGLALALARIETLEGVVDELIGTAKPTGWRSAMFMESVLAARLLDGCAYPPATAALARRYADIIDPPKADSKEDGAP
jgi:hypothetical protein